MSTTPPTGRGPKSGTSWASVQAAILQTLRPYQRAYLTDPSRRKTWLASRRIGKSFTVALEAVLYAVRGDGPDNLVVSHDQEASNDLLNYAKAWAQVLERAGIPGAKVERETATEIRFESRGRVCAIPGGRPAAIRHYGGNTWLDEAAHHARQKANLAAAGPVISQANGRMRLISTPLSDGDEFWRIARPDSVVEGWSRHRTTIHDAIAQGHVKRDGTPILIDELRLDVPDSDAFAAEFECVPLSDADSYFPTELLDRCKALPALAGGSLYGGFDVARSVRGDMAVICSVRRDGERYAAERIEMASRGMSFDAQQDLAARAMTEGSWVRMAVDATGLGMETAERLQRRLGGSSKVDAVTMTVQSKADMMTGLRSLMDQGKLSLPDDRDLYLDLHAIKRIVGDSSIRYDSDRNERGHADRAWALALAVRAAGRQVSETQRTIQIRRARKPREPMY